MNPFVYCRGLLESLKSQPRSSGAYLVWVFRAPGPVSNRPMLYNRPENEQELSEIRRHIHFHNNNFKYSRKQISLGSKLEFEPLHHRHVLVAEL